MKNKNRKRVISVLACMMAAFSMVTTTSGQFSSIMREPVAIVSAASSSSGKLTGESRVYISNLWDGEICISVNTRAQLENLKNFLKGLRDHSTTTKNIASVAASKLPVPGGKLSQSLIKLLIKSINTGGVERSAKSALSEIDRLTKLYPNRGIKVYISGKPWKVRVS